MNYPTALSGLELAARRSRSPADQRAMRIGAVALRALLGEHQALKDRHEKLLESSLVLIPGRKP